MVVEDVPVTVIEVCSPDMICVKLDVDKFISEEKTIELHSRREHLQLMMASYFKEVGQQAKMNFDTKKGTICAAQIDGIWHRVRIQDIFVHPSVYNCLLLDYGVFRDCTLGDLRKMPESMLDEPFAIKCLVIDKLTPMQMKQCLNDEGFLSFALRKSDSWSISSMSHVKNLLNDKKVKITINNEEGFFLYGDLFYLNDYGREFSLREYLLSEKFCFDCLETQQTKIENVAATMPKTAAEITMHDFALDDQDLSNQYFDMRKFHEEYYSQIFNCLKPEDQKYEKEIEFDTSNIKLNDMVISDKNYDMALVKGSKPKTFYTTFYLFNMHEILSDAIKKRLKFNYPTVSQRYAWNYMLKNDDFLMVSSKKSGCTFGYLLPIFHRLLNYIHNENLRRRSVPKSKSPFVIIIADSWHTGHVISYYCSTLTGRNSQIHVESINNTSHTLEQLETLFLNGLDLVIVTPKILKQMAEQNIIDYTNLLEIVIDHADLTIENSLDEISYFISHAKESSTRARISVFASYYTPTLEKFTYNHLKTLQMSRVVISSSEQMVFSKIPIDLQYFDSAHLMEELIAKVRAANQKKIAIVVSDDNFLNQISRALKSFSISHFTLESTLQKYDVACEVSKINTYDKSQKSVIIISDSQVESANINDCDYVISADIPFSGSLWSQRIYLCHDWLENLDKNVELLQIVTDTDHAGNLEMFVDFLSRCTLRDSNILNRLKVHLMDIDDEIYSKFLCNYLKLYGSCVQRNSCPCRHSFKKCDFKANPNQSLIDPSANVKLVKGKMSHVVSPNFMYMQPSEIFLEDGSIIDMRPAIYELQTKLANFFADPMNCHPINSLTAISVNSVYAHKTAGNYYVRVKVIMLHPGKKLASKDMASCFHIDTGKDENIPISELYHLPANLSNKKSLAMEVILCNILPVDNSYEWSPVTTNKASQLVMNLEASIEPTFITSLSIFCHKIENKVLVEDFNEYAVQYCLPDSYFNMGIAVESKMHSEVLFKLKEELFYALKTIENDPEEDVQDVPSQYLSSGINEEYAHILNDPQATDSIENVMFSPSNEQVNHNSIEGKENLKDLSADQPESANEMSPQQVDSEMNSVINDSSTDKQSSPSKPKSTVQNLLGMAGRFFQKAYSKCKIKVLWGQEEYHLRLTLQVDGAESMKVEFEDEEQQTIKIMLYNKSTSLMTQTKLKLYRPVEMHTDNSLVLNLFKRQMETWPFLLDESFECETRVKIVDDFDYYEDPNYYSGDENVMYDEIRNNDQQNAAISCPPPDSPSSFEDDNSCFDRKSSSDFEADMAGLRTMNSNS